MQKGDHSRSQTRNNNTVADDRSRSGLSHQGNSSPTTSYGINVKSTLLGNLSESP